MRRPDLSPSRPGEKSQMEVVGDDGLQRGPDMGMSNSLGTLFWDLMPAVFLLGGGAEF